MHHAEIGEPALQNGVARSTGTHRLVELAADLNAEQYSRMMEIVSGDPRGGWTRWTISLLAEETVRRGIVAQMSSHELRQVTEKAAVFGF
jgi:hypothetical protein